MMGNGTGGVSIRRVDIQAAIFAAVLVVISCLSVFLFSYHLTHRNMLDMLTTQVNSIYTYAETYLDDEAFATLRTPGDMDSELYQKDQRLLNSVRIATGVRYLYTATRTESGDFIYLVDGLDHAAGDYRRPGDLIEPEIIPELERAMNNEVVLPLDIKATDWGKIFIAYFPVHDGERVVGVIGIEFDAESQYNVYSLLRIATPLIILGVCLLAAVFSFFFFRRISNPTYRDLSNTDRLTLLKNRNSFDLDLQNLNASHQRDAVGILFADLNHLKEVNDTLGHPSGDLYLRLAASVIENECQGLGTPYRVGGDEFVVLTTEVGTPQLQSLADVIASHFVKLRTGWSVEIGISIGVASFDPGLDKDLSATFRRADLLMYQEKHAGRNTSECV